MQEITLHAAGWTTREDFYAAYLPAVRAPEWHGHTLDAILDSLRGDVNGIDPPFRIRVIGVGHLNDECRRFLESLAGIVGVARSEGIPVELVFE